MPAQAAPLPILTVFCFDPTGYERVKITLAPGDTVEYKRNGFRGTCRGKILAVTLAKKPLHIQPIARDDVPYGEPIRRGVDGIHRAWRDGKLLGIPGAFDGRVLAYETPTEVGVDGWAEVERVGHRSVRCNSAAPGWPARALAVGEIVRCEMRIPTDRDLPTWFIL